jgi:predicted dehydrogenase
MNFGVIGAGVVGRLRASTVLTNKSTRLVAVADSDRTAATRAATGGARAVAEWRSIVDDGTIEAVIISTPVHLHEEMAVAALESGKHVLCEKPLANSVAACRRILETARKAGRTLAVGFNHRYYPSLRFVKDAVDAGTLGALDHVRVFGGHDGLSNFRADWMYQSRLSGGGAMMDVGIHMTDLARHLVGEIDEVYGIATGRIWKVPGSEDNAIAIMKSPGGVPVFYQATWTEWKGYRSYIEAYGELGMVRGYYAPMFNLLVTHERPGARRRRQFKFYPSAIVREKVKGWQSTTLASFSEELSDFLAMVGGRPVRLADGWAGLRAVEIAQAVYQSTLEGRPIRLSKD